MTSGGEFARGPAMRERYEGESAPPWRLRYAEPDVYDEEEGTYLCHACLSIASILEGGDACADDDARYDCTHAVPCFFVCERCWCERRERSPGTSAGQEPRRG